MQPFVEIKLNSTHIDTHTERLGTRSIDPKLKKLVRSSIFWDSKFYGSAV